MGCGSSSTSVQTFSDQEAKRYNRDHHREHSRSSSNNNKPEQSSSPPNVPSRQASAKSTTSKKSQKREGSAGSVISRRSSRENSAKTKDTYTIQRRNSDIADIDTVEEFDNVENVDKTLDNEISADADVQERQKEEARQQYEEIQKQTFLTEPSKREPKENPFGEIPPEVNKAELHEETAKRKEDKRANYNADEIEALAVVELGLSPLTIPSMDPDQTIGNYTVDDIVEHNNEVGGNDWFKYGRKVYSFGKMRAIIQTRIDEMKERNVYISEQEYPIHLSKKLKITRSELPKILEACHVGNAVDIPVDEYRARIKQSAEHVLEEPAETEYLQEYHAQLSRWIADYPYSKIDNDKVDTTVDPNEQPFPLPKDILADPTVLRKWIESWEPFDFEVPEGGSWTVAPTLDIDWGDAHEVFVEQVQTHDDKAMQPFDMTVDGDVAWVEIELDLIKNDKTTPEQDAVWTTRASRTNINDPAWQAERRKQLGEALKARYENKNIKYDLEGHARFAEELEEHWKVFLELCEKVFIAPTGSFRITKDMPNEYSYPDDQMPEVQTFNDGTDANIPSGDVRAGNDSPELVHLEAVTGSRQGSQCSMASLSKRKGSNASNRSEQMPTVDNQESRPVSNNSAMVEKQDSRPGSKSSNISLPKRSNSNASKRSDQLPSEDKPNSRPPSSGSMASMSKRRESDASGSNRIPALQLQEERPGSVGSRTSQSKRRDSDLSRQGSGLVLQRPGSKTSQNSQNVKNGSTNELQNGDEHDSNASKGNEPDKTSQVNVDHDANENKAESAENTERSVINGDENKAEDGNETDRKNVDAPELSGDANNAVGPNERVSTTETNDSGLELEN